MCLSTQRKNNIKYNLVLLWNPRDTYLNSHSLQTHRRWDLPSWHNRSHRLGHRGARHNRKSRDPACRYHFHRPADCGVIPSIWHCKEKKDTMYECRGIVLKFRINDLFVYSGHFVISNEKDNVASSFLNNFVYSGHFVISKEKDNVASSFLNNKMSWINEQVVYSEL